MDHDDELEGVLSRSSAQFIGHSASLIETVMRRIREQAEQTRHGEVLAGDDARSAVGSTGREGSAYPPEAPAGATRVQAQQRKTVDEELQRRVMERHGLDIAHVGDRHHDRAWVDRASAVDVIDLLRASERDAGSAAEAARVRDNLMDRIREFGVDLDSLLSSPPEAAAEELRDKRAQHLGDDVGAEREATEVASLMGKAQAADREADSLDARAVDGEAAAHSVSRSERVQSTGTHTETRAAAGLAAKDHPTNPRQAASTAAKQANRARRPAGRGADRERGHAGR